MCLKLKLRFKLTSGKLSLSKILKIPGALTDLIKSLCTRQKNELKNENLTQYYYFKSHPPKRLSVKLEICIFYCSFLNDQKRTKKIAAGDKLPEILSHGYKNINSSPDRRALSGSSNNIFLLNAIAQNFLSAIYHRRVILNKLPEKIQMRDSFHLN